MESRPIRRTLILFFVIVFNFPVSAATAVTLIAPNGGETLPSGSVCTLQWNAPIEAETFKLKYSMNNGATWKRLQAVRIGGKKKS